MNKKQEYSAIIALFRWFFAWAKSKPEGNDYDQPKRLEQLLDKLAEIGKEASDPKP